MENQTPYWEQKLAKWRTRVLDVRNGDRLIYHTTICMHCDNPPCVPVCPTRASYVDKENGGVVLVDYDKCISCGYCVEACPYGARYMLTYEDVQEAKSRFEIVGQVSLEHLVPHADKCTFCIHRVTNEELPSSLRKPACVTTCVGHARIFGDLDDPNSEVYKIVNSGQAKELYSELGTQPRVYYILPEGEDIKTSLPPSPNPVSTNEIQLQEAIKPLKRVAEVGAAVTAAVVVANAIKTSIKEKNENEESE
jgi:Fe-S-cluster-containing dehydrogenase component